MEFYVGGTEGVDNPVGDFIVKRQDGGIVQRIQQLHYGVVLDSAIHIAAADDADIAVRDPGLLQLF